MLLGCSQLKWCGYVFMKIMLHQLFFLTVFHEIIIKINNIVIMSNNNLDQ